MATLAEAKYQHWKTELAGKTVSQIDHLKSPSGVLGLNAWNRVRLERLNEERIVARKTKLLTMFPGITDLQLNDIDLEDESNGGVGLVIRLKKIEEPELG